MTKLNSWDAFETQKCMMSATGAWPVENPSFWYNVKGFVCYLLCLILLVTLFAEVCGNLNDFRKLSEIFYMILTIVTYSFKHPGFFYRRKTFIRMIKLLQDPVLLSYPDDLDNIMTKNVGQLQIFVKVFTSLVYTYVTVTLVTPLFDNKPLPFPFPYDLGTYNWIMYAFQVVSLMIFACNNPCLDSLAAAVMGIASTHLEILNQRIIKINNGVSKNKSQTVTNDVVNRLKECVGYHMAIIQYVDYIEQIFSFGILVQFIGSMVIICITLVDLVLVPIKSPQFIVLCNYFINLNIELFMYCWFGNEIHLKSLETTNACYLFDWYNCETEVQKYLFIIMERSRRPLSITAFGFTKLSLTAFTSVLQWSYSYYALLMKLLKS